MTSLSSWSKSGVTKSVHLSSLDLDRPKGLLYIPIKFRLYLHLLEVCRTSTRLSVLPFGIVVEPSHFLGLAADCPVWSSQQFTAFSLTCRQIRGHNSVYPLPTVYRLEEISCTVCVAWRCHHCGPWYLSEQTLQRLNFSLQRAASLPEFSVHLLH